MIQKLIFKLFKPLSINDLVYKFPEQIVDFDNIAPNSEKKPLFKWHTDCYSEESKEAVSLEQFQNLFQGHFYFKKGVELV
jgi:hypothetical protein